MGNVDFNVITPAMSSNPLVRHSLIKLIFRETRVPYLMEHVGLFTQESQRRNPQVLISTASSDVASIIWHHPAVAAGTWR